MSERERVKWRLYVRERERERERWFRLGAKMTVVTFKLKLKKAAVNLIKALQKS